MDRDDLNSVLRSAGVDLWTLIETAIGVAAADHGAELKARRDGFVERLYAPPPPDRCRNCESDGRIEPEKAIGSRSNRSPATPQSNEEDDAEPEDDYSIDQEQRRIFAIKDSLEDPDQSDDAVAALLQKLADMDITFKALKETDIGRHVNKMRKHPSSEVRRLVKILVRKWKEIVDEWVKSANPENSSSPAIITDGDSPQQIAPARSSQNGHQASDIGYSPNPHNGRMMSEEPKAKAMVKREAPVRPAHPTPSSAAPTKLKDQKESLLDPERLASARKRLHENYQKDQNARKQRTCIVMDINEIPKPKNGFISRNKGGPQGKHW